MKDGRDAIVMGAGISGLVCAYRLKSLGIDVVLLESSNRAGGVIRSEAVDGFLIERGTNSSQGTEELLALVAELGITDELIEGDPKAPAYVYHDGRLHAVPSGPVAFIKSDLFSARGKLRLLREVFIPPRLEDSEESVASFARRRIGEEAADRMVAPFVSGIYAGDAEHLSVQAAFPRLAALEREYGGLFRGMIAKASEARRAKKAARDVMDKATPARKRMVSFRRGMAFLPDALASRLGEDLRMECENCRISNLESEVSNARSGDSVPEGEDYRFRVSFDRSGSRERMAAKHLVIATPARAAANLIASLSSELSGLLKEINYPQLAIVHLAYDARAIRVPLDGFGFLVAPREGLNILGCVWNSSLFEGRAPEGKSLLTVFIGGARNPEFVNFKDAELISTVHTDLQKVLGIMGPPHTIAITRYERAIPQYDLGHAERMRQIEKTLECVPGLHLAGNYLHGVSTGDCIKEANNVAEAVARSLL